MPERIELLVSSYTMLDIKTFSGFKVVKKLLKRSWTDQQRVQAAREGWGYRLLFSACLVGVFLVADALFIGAQQVRRYMQDIRSH